MLLENEYVDGSIKVLDISVLTNNNADDLALLKTLINEHMAKKQANKLSKKLTYEVQFNNETHKVKLKQSLVNLLKRNGKESYYAVGKVLGEGAEAVVKSSSKSLSFNKDKNLVIEEVEVALHLNKPPELSASRSRNDYQQTVKHETDMAAAVLGREHVTQASFRTKANKKQVGFWAMPLIKGMNLAVFLAENKAQMSAEQLQTLALACLYALKTQYHDKKIIHRDLKPENIMVSSADCKTFEVKIIDFGYSEYADKCSAKFCGSLGYMAPEVVAVEDNIDFYKADIYSMGKTLMNIFSPKEGSSQEFVNENDLQVLQRSGLCQGLEAVVVKMFDENPNNRQYITDVIKAYEAPQNEKFVQTKKQFLALVEKALRELPEEKSWRCGLPIFYDETAEKDKYGLLNRIKTGIDNSASYSDLQKLAGVCIQSQAILAKQRWRKPVHLSGSRSETTLRGLQQIFPGLFPSAQVGIPAGYSAQDVILGKMAPKGDMPTP